MKKLLFLILLAPIFIMAQYADDAVFIKNLSDDVLKNGQAHDLLRYLTKNIGGRLAGSPQFDKAVVWGEKTMKLLGADRVYLQECMMPNWNRGGKDLASVSSIDGKLSNRTLDVLALGNSMGTGGKALSAEVIAVADFADLEAKKDQLKGKIVYYNYQFNSTNIDPAKSYGEAGIYRRSGASRAAKYGAVGIMIRSLTEATDNNPHTGAMVYNDSFPKIPAIALGGYDANYIWELSKKSSCRVSFTTNGHYLPDAKGYNVIAEIKGSEFPEQIITVGGHLDSWDVNEGAHDDGTGVVHTMEVLRAMKAMGYKPKRTIHFVLFANEENGLRGGSKYAEEAKKNNEIHLFALESDSGGFTPRGFKFTIDPALLAKMQAWLPLLKPYGTESLEMGGGGADIGPLNRNFGTALAGFEPDGQRYFDIHHARTDVFENVHKRELLLGAINMASLIYLVDKYGL